MKTAVPMKYLAVRTEGGRFKAAAGFIVKRAKSSRTVPTCPECGAEYATTGRCYSACHERGLV